MRADEIIKRVEDAEKALRGAVEKNYQLISVQEAQAAKIKELETLLEESQAAVEATKRKAVEATSKAVADFLALAEYEDEKVEFFVDVYDVGRQSIQDIVAAKYPELNLNFFNEVWDPTAIDAPAADVSAPDATS